MQGEGAGGGGATAAPRALGVLMGIFRWLALVRGRWSQAEARDLLGYGGVAISKAHASGMRR